jgi:DNA-binding NarL/FixJ family response regulator
MSGGVPERIRFISIDDHPSISEALGQVARDYDDLEMVASFTSIASVPRPFQQPGVLVDVVLLDLNLPGTTGFSGLRSVAEWGVLTLVFSASAQERVAAEALDAGAAGFVSKSLPTRQVLDGVRAVARGELVMAGVEVPPGSARLTVAEERLMEALVEESRSKALAERLNLSPRTIDNSITELYIKLGLEGSSRTRAALRDWARANGYSGSASG